MLVFTTNNINVHLTKEGAQFLPDKDGKNTLGSTSSDRSLPVDVPSTPEMDELFASAFDINMTLRDQDWNPNLKAECILNSSDGLPLIKGYAQLIDITRERDGVVYHVVIYGTVKELWTNVGDKLLRGNENPRDDLDFSEYEHDYNIATIEDSWSNLCDVNGTPTDLSGDGLGYRYPMIDVGLNAANIRRFKTTDWRPALFWHEILLKIFQKAGITWDSAFLDGAFFKSKLFPFCGERFLISTNQMIAEGASATRTGSDQERNFYNTPSGNQDPDRSTGEIMVFDNQVTDPSSQYDPTTGEFTAADDMEVVVEGQIVGYLKCLIQVVYADNAPTYEHDIKFDFEIIKDSGGGAYTVMGTFGCWSRFTATPSGGVDIIGVGDLSVPITGHGIFRSSPFRLAAGEKVYIKPRCMSEDELGSRQLYTYFKAVVKIGSFINFLRTSSVVTGQALDPTLCLPENLKQKDFIAMCVKRFNLYLDPIDSNVITVEPRDDFYTDDYEDWSKLLATDKELIINPMGLLNAKQYDFVHAKDEDKLNKLHFEKYGYVYGRQRIFTENEFLKEVKVIDDMIAPTPSISQVDRIIPCISFVNSAGEVLNKAAKPRMLHWAGLFSCLEWENDEDGVITTYTQYPYAGMFDSPFNPSLILTWGEPSEWFYTKYPNQSDLKTIDNNLVTMFWYRTIWELANKNSRMVTAWFWLDPVNYYKASFRKKFFFNNAYHRLIKIEDFVATDDLSLTKCIFLKIEPVAAPSTSQTVITGGTGGGGGGTGTGTGVIDNGRQGDDSARSSVPIGGGISTGEGGGIANEGYLGFVNAGKSRIGPENKNITILGGDGVTMPQGAENIIMLNSTNSPLQNDTVYLNNQPIFQTVRITLDDTDLGGIDVTPLQVLLNPVEGAIIDILDAYALMTFDTAAYEDVTLTLQNDTGTDLITFGTGFTNQPTTQRRKGEKISYELLIDESINISASANMSTGSGSLFLLINYRIIQL